MRCSLNLLASMIILAAPAAGLAQSRFNVGTSLSQEEIKTFDFMIGRRDRDFLLGTEPPGKARISLRSGALSATGRMEKGG